MSLKITLLPEDSGLHNYFNVGDCPVARAFKRAGYIDPNIGGDMAYYTHSQSGERLMIKFPKVLVDKAYNWTIDVQTESWSMEI